MQRNAREQTRLARAHSRLLTHVVTRFARFARSPRGHQQRPVEAQHPLEADPELRAAVVPAETPEARIGGGGCGGRGGGGAGDPTSPLWPHCGPIAAPSSPRSPDSPTALRGSRSRGKLSASAAGPTRTRRGKGGGAATRGGIAGAAPERHRNALCGDSVRPPRNPPPYGAPRDPIGHTGPRRTRRPYSPTGPHRTPQPHRTPEDPKPRRTPWDPITPEDLTGPLTPQPHGTP